jgi:hypothetical protein
VPIWMLGKGDGHRVMACVYRTQIFCNPGDANLALGLIVLVLLVLAL